MSEHGRGPGAILRSCKSRKTILSGTFECDYANGMRKLVAELEFQSLEYKNKLKALRCSSPKSMKQ